MMLLLDDSLFSQPWLMISMPLRKSFDPRDDLPAVIQGQQLNARLLEMEDRIVSRISARILAM
jgi:hypothetical protein